MAHSSFADLIQSETPTLIDFSAEWCGPCKMMAPILADLKAKIGDTARIIKIDIDKNPQLATSYQVQSVPTLILFKGSKVMWRQSGVVTTEQIKKVIDQFV
jgi:thioredoxin 1